MKKVISNVLELFLPTPLNGLMNTSGTFQVVGMNHKQNSAKEPPNTLDKIENEDSAHILIRAVQKILYI